MNNGVFERVNIRIAAIAAAERDKVATVTGNIIESRMSVLEARVAKMGDACEALEAKLDRILAALASDHPFLLPFEDAV